MKTVPEPMNFFNFEQKSVVLCYFVPTPLHNC